MHENIATMHDIGTVDNAKGFAYVVICNKNPNTDPTKGPGQVQTDETGKPTLTIGIPVKTTVEDYESNA